MEAWGHIWAMTGPCPFGRNHAPPPITLPAPQPRCSLLYHRSLTLTGHGWMGVPSLPMQHREDVQAAASLASRSQRALGPRLPVGSAGSRMMGLQFPSKVSPLPGKHLGIYLWDCLNYFPPHPTLCSRQGQGQGPETPLGSRQTLEGRMEKLHRSPFCLLNPGQTLLINHRAQAMLAPPACKAGIVNRPQHWFHPSPLSMAMN